MNGEIYVAMAKAMAEIGTIGKTKKNAQQGYQFRGIDDVVAHVQPVFSELGIVMVPEVLEREREMIPTKAGGVMASVRLLVKHTFYAKDGSSVVATTFGEAMDSGDKAANKAMSAALKYALTEGLMIPTYEADRDTEEASPEIAARPAAPSQTAKVSPQGANEMIPALQASINAIEQRRSNGAPEKLFPKYGNSASQPIRGAAVKDLIFYANGAKKTLADPGKARFHATERELLAAIEEEMARQGAEG